MGKPDWIAVDWGTSNLRLWALQSKNGRSHPIAEKNTPDGMATLAQNQFESTLLSHCEDWLADKPLPILCCGMVGARQGWIEAPYEALPWNPAQARYVKAPVEDERLQVSILGGLCQMNPPDVMRGEETQIAGFLVQNPGFSGTLCLPGTHCKWVKIESGTVVSFRTVMTGELFSLIRDHSLLRHSLSGQDTETHQEAEFCTAVKTAYDQPQSVLPRLFEIRAKSLLTNESDGANHLSGLLIGMEIAGIRDLFIKESIHIIGNPALSQNYATALSTCGITAYTYDSSALTLAGLGRFYQQLMS